MTTPKLNPKRARENIEEKLALELQRLRDILKTGYELEVKWMPNPDHKLSGEVKGNQICIYDTDEAEALKTLKHETIDYAISKVIEPYKAITNKLISMINEDAYKKKEKLVETLTKLV